MTKTRRERIRARLLDSKHLCVHCWTALLHTQRPPSLACANSKVPRISISLLHYSVARPASLCCYPLADLSGSTFRSKQSAAVSTSIACSQDYTASSVVSTLSSPLPGVLLTVAFVLSSLPVGTRVISSPPFPQSATFEPGKHRGPYSYSDAAYLSSGTGSADQVTHRHRADHT